MRRLALIFSLIAAPLWAQVQGVELDDPVALPDFHLENDRGETFDRDTLTGHWTLVMFGFLSCPDVCPFTLGNLEAAVTETSMRVRPDNVPQVVFVSVDPARDAETVSDYARYFHPDFKGFTGARDQIDTLIQATDSFYRLMKPDASGYYEVQHSASVSVIAPDGTLRAKLQPPFDPGATAEFLARLQIAYRRSLNQ
ncbi:SCO family protein [Mameliella sp. CS4]|uniref:SCO family protein n=1 Tax=Mameliella sp. CS4 TaxID=2862329 RepID=UPI001C5E1C88|nr:SCO family protein [Mameliella sp. CS4]MBW4984454.1 SCO family protein [Mameliella sp. CS4]